MKLETYSANAVTFYFATHFPETCHNFINDVEKMKQSTMTVIFNHLLQRISKQKKLSIYVFIDVHIHNFDFKIGAILEKCHLFDFVDRFCPTRVKLTLKMKHKISTTIKIYLSLKEPQQKKNMNIRFYRYLQK